MKDRSTYADWSSILALAGLLFFVVACIYPIAWSPDSEKLVFPQSTDGDKGIHSLVMTDRKGVEIRAVAEIDPSEGCLSPASWSPNGKYIAYIRYSRSALSQVPNSVIPSETAPFVLNLFIQDAKTGSQQCVYSSGLHAHEVKPIDHYPPEWTRNSRFLAVFEIEESTPVLTMLDRRGKVRAKTLLPKALLEVGAAISPNGRYGAYLTRQANSKDKQFDIRIVDLKKSRTNVITTVTGSKDRDGLECRPAWSFDSESLYYAAIEKDERDSRSRVVKYSLRTGESETVWEKADQSVSGISLSARSDVIALDCETKGDNMIVEIMDLSTGDSDMFYSSYHCGTAISHDGHWVAFCPAANSIYGGCILSTVGNEAYVFFPSMMGEEEVELLFSNVMILSLQSAFRGRGKELTVEEMERLFPDELSLYRSEWMDLYVEAATRIIGNSDHPSARISLLCVKAQQLLGQLFKSDSASRDDVEADIRSVIDEIRAIPIGATYAGKMEEELGKVLEGFSNAAEESP